MIRLQSRIFWMVVLLMHAVMAAGWWWFMPRGFAASHPRYWVNQVLPFAAIALVVGALAASRRGKLPLVRAAIVMLAFVWLGLAISSRVVFPISLRVRFLIPLAGFTVVLLAAFAPALREARWSMRLTSVAALIGLSLGAWFPFTQRAEAPSTHPSQIAATQPVLAEVAEQPVTRSLRGVDVQPASGLVTLQRGRYMIWLQPVLTFRSRSPDRFWTVFAPPEARTSPPRVLSGLEKRELGVSMSFRDDASHLLTVDEAGDGWGAVIEATSTLPASVYSHLNTFCEFQFAGHRKLSVRFSPCGDQAIDVMHTDYPVGNPARFAYLDTGGAFRVVQASSGEKGPFTTLAEARMSRDDPLVITLHDRGVPMARIELLDWARQASTAISPTAGWRVPVNAIEFSRDTKDENSTASFFVTLAGTSVGRGFDSVGHAAGTYRSRVRAGWVE